MPVQAYDMGPQINHIKSFSDSLDRIMQMKQKEQEKKWGREVMLDFRRARNSFNLIEGNLDKIPKADRTKSLAAKMSFLNSIERAVKLIHNNNYFSNSLKSSAKEMYETWEKLSKKTEDPHGKTMFSLSKLPEEYRWVKMRHTQEEMGDAFAGMMGPGMVTKVPGVAIKATKAAVDVAKAGNFMEKIKEVCNLMKIKYDLMLKPWKVFSGAEKQKVAEEVAEFARRNTGKGPEEVWKVFEGALKDPGPALRELMHANSVRMESLVVKHGDDAVMITKESVLNSRAIRTPQDWAKAVDAISGMSGEVKGAVASKNLGTQLVIQYDDIVVHCFKKPNVMAGIAKDAPFIVDRIERAGGPLAGVFRAW